MKKLVFWRHVGFHILHFRSMQSIVCGYGRAETKIFIMRQGVPFPLFETLNTHIQKAVPEKTKIARKYGIKKDKKKRNLKYQFESFTRRIVAGVSISIGCLNEFNNCLSKKVLLFFCFFFRDFY